jgi:hypothetical protein
LERAQALTKIVRPRSSAAERVLTAELANVLISIRMRSVGAEGESSKSSINDFGFCGCQFASTPANQYPVLVVHIFSFHQLGPLERPKLVKRSLCGGNGYTSAPHSLLKVSPSALA